MANIPAMPFTMHQNVNPCKPTVYFIEDLEDVSRISEESFEWLESYSHWLFNHPIRDSHKNCRKL